VIAGNHPGITWMQRLDHKANGDAISRAEKEDDEVVGM
jgi:hypothetical protein